MSRQPKLSEIFNGLRKLDPSVCSYEDVTLFVSGCCTNGDNPLPGVGVARCVRQMFPGLRIVGVDQSLESSGMSDPVFDGIVVMDHFDGPTKIHDHWNEVCMLCCVVVGMFVFGRWHTTHWIMQ